MKDLTVLTLRELEADYCAMQGRMEALEAAIEAKKREPDYERFREALDLYYTHAKPATPLDEMDKRNIDVLSRLYPALRRAMEGDKPDDGWIEWNGGDRPVGEDVRVQVRFRNGNTEEGQAGDWCSCWWNDGLSLDIIAYRVLP